MEGSVELDNNNNNKDEEENKPDDAFYSRAKEACVRFWQKFYDLIKAIAMRIILAAALFILTWRAAAVNGSDFPTTLDSSTNNAISRDRFYSIEVNSSYNNASTLIDSGVVQEAWYVYWMPALGILLFIPEFLVSWFFNGGHEYKWWSPILAIYIACGVMPIWIIEVDLYVLKWYGYNKHPGMANFEELQDVFEDEKFGNIAGFDFGGVRLRPYEWARILEQMFFIAIILAKWLSPKGVMSRDKLSQLLLVFIAMATDILDLLESLMYVGIGNRFGLVVLVMLFLSFSSLQFSLNYTATLSRPARIASHELEENEKPFQKASSMALIVIYTDMWAMLTTIVLQDGAFFILRLYFLFGLEIVTFGNVFFTMKNGVVLFMDIYRVVSIILEEFFDKADGKADSEEIVHRKKLLADHNDDQIVEEQNRAEICLTITADSTVKAVSEFVMLPNLLEQLSGSINNNNENNDNEDRFKRKNWRSLRSRTTNVGGDDDDLHLIYEVDILLEDHRQNIDNYNDAAITDISTADPVYLRDVRLRNVTRRKQNKQKHDADAPVVANMQHSAAIRWRTNQIVPFPTFPVSELAPEAVMVTPATSPVAEKTPLPPPQAPPPPKLMRKSAKPTPPPSSKPKPQSAKPLPPISSSKPALKPSTSALKPGTPMAKQPDKPVIVEDAPADVPDNKHQPETVLKSSAPSKPNSPNQVENPWEVELVKVD